MAVLSASADSKGEPEGKLHAAERATAESYDGYSRLRETLHLLQKRFSELGLNSSDFECRRGSVKHPSDYTDQELQFMQDDEFDGWRV